MLSNEHRHILLEIAQQSIAYGLENHQSLPVEPNEYTETLQQKRATFVTLHIADQLRGCIGTLTAQQSLVEDISHNAYAAAFRDPRFSPLEHSEYPDLHYHISVLSDSSKIQFSSEAELLEQLRPGIDGLVLEDNGHRGTFLPSVWEQLPEPTDFLDHLKQKAGLSTAYWSNTIRISRYTVESFSS